MHRLESQAGYEGVEALNNTVGYDLKEDRRPGLDEAVKRIMEENPKMGFWDAVAKAKAEFHRSLAVTSSPASGRPDQP